MLQNWLQWMNQRMCLASLMMQLLVTTTFLSISNGQDDATGSDVSPFSRENVPQEFRSEEIPTRALHVGWPMGDFSIDAFLKLERIFHENDKAKNGPGKLDEDARMPIAEEEGDGSLRRHRRSSVSWLLSAMIKMCHNYPTRCLGQGRGRVKEMQTDLSLLQKHT